MSPVLWLAAKEVISHRGRAALAAAVVAATVAAALASEVVGRGREEEVAAQVDQLGPALRLVPEGVTAGALARLDLGARVLPAGAAEAVRAALGHRLRATEERLVLSREVAGALVPVIGVSPEKLPRDVFESEVAVGSALGERLGPGGSLTLGGRAYRIAVVLPSTASADDLAVFLPLASAQALAGAERVNEVRVFLRSGVVPVEAEERLRSAALPGAVLRTDRGEVADAQTQQTLARHRTFAYGVMAVVVGLCLLIAAHLDTAERRLELATLVALGASGRTVLATVVTRSVLVAVVGAVLGVGFGVVAALLQRAATLPGIEASWPIALTTLAAAVGIGAIAAVPTALAAAARDPVGDLQEG